MTTPYDPEQAPDSDVISHRDLLAEAEQRSATAWQRLGLRFRSITPSGVARFLMVMGALGVTVWAVIYTWPALLPFAVGGVLAYILLPVVNRLDRVMPRPLAALLTMLALTGFVIALIARAVPAIAQQSVLLYQAIPTREQIQDVITPLTTRDLSSLPPGVQALIRDQVNDAVTIIRDRVDAYANSLPNLVLFTIQAALSTVSIVLGLLVIPTWLLALLRDQRNGVRTIDRSLPSWLRADFWAIVGIVDRALKAFLRGQFLLGLAIGLGMYGGLFLAQRLGFEGVRYPILLATFLGLMGIIPQIGFVIGLLAVALVGLLHSWPTALAILAVYLIVNYLVNLLIVPHLERRVVDIHPVVQVLVMVAISQFGLFWIILATPLLAVTRDLFLYVYGRLGDPPRPAGLLPNTVSPDTVTSTASGAYPTGPRIPMADRRRRLVR